MTRATCCRSLVWLSLGLVTLVSLLLPRSILASLPQSSFTSAPLLPRSTLALSHGISSVQHLLHRLVRAPHVSTVVAVCHPDLHDPAELDHLRASAHCVASVSPATALQADFVRAEHGLTPRGVLRTVAQRARRWGQVAARASSQLFAVTSSGVRMFPMPPEDVDAKKLARAVLQVRGELDTLISAPVQVEARVAHLHPHDGMRAQHSRYCIHRRWRCTRGSCARTASAYGGFECVPLADVAGHGDGFEGERRC